MNKIPFAILLLLALTMTIAGCGGGGGGGGRSPGGTGSIQGYVYALAGSKAVVTRQATPPTGFEPVQAAAVTVTTVAAGTTSNASGYFKIDGIQPGVQTVTVSKAGMAAVHFPVTVIPNQTVDAGTIDGDTILGKKDWTFLVYMDADNDLERYGILNMNQMEMVGSNDNINIVVQFDRGPGHDTSNGDWTTTRRYYVTKDNDTATIHSTLVQDMGEQNMADPAVLHDFVQWGVKTYPASHYAVVLWNHGDGWRSRARARGIFYDDTTNPYLGMSMAQLNSALDVGVKLEVVAVDACMMQMLEVDYEIRDRARYIVSSEETSTSAGYAYNTFLTQLAANPSMTGLDLSNAIVDTYVEGNQGVGVTNSVVDPGRLAYLATRVQSLAAYLRTHWAAQKGAFDSARAACQAYSIYDYKDLYDFAAHLKSVSSDSQVKSLSQAVMDAISDPSVSSVLYEAHSGSTVVDSYGISIYIPAHGSYMSSYGTALTFTQQYPDWAWLLANL